MTTQQQRHSLTTGKLYLPKSRAIKHYLDCFILMGLTLFFAFLIGKGFINRQGNYDSPYFLLFLVFPLSGLLIYINKRQELRLKEILSSLSKYDNHKAVKETLKMLGWDVKVDNKGYIEAYTGDFGFWTWTDQMISILIDDNKIMFNSIGNVDTFATQPFSWRQNLRNIKQFKETFDRLSQGNTANKP